jgi:hypothetical protein
LYASRLLLRFRTLVRLLTILFQLQLFTVEIIFGEVQVLRKRRKLGMSYDNHNYSQPTLWFFNNAGSAIENVKYWMKWAGSGGKLRRSGMEAAFYICKHYTELHLQELKETTKLFLQRVSLPSLETNAFWIKVTSWANLLWFLFCLSILLVLFLYVLILKQYLSTRSPNV